MLVSEPDPRKNWKDGLGDRLGWNCNALLEYGGTLLIGIYLGYEG